MGFQQSYNDSSRYPQGNTLKTNELFYLPLQWGAQSPHHCDGETNTCTIPLTFYLTMGCAIPTSLRQLEELRLTMGCAIPNSLRP